MNTRTIIFAVSVLTGCTGGAGAPEPGGSKVDSGGQDSGPGTSAGGKNGAPNCTPGVPATSQIRRVTNAQYDRMVRDLLGVTSLRAYDDSAPSNLLATDQEGGLTDVAWAGYKTVAEAIAAQVMADPNLKANFIACDPAVAACLHDTVVSFGRKAYRRPLSAEDIAAFDSIIAKGREITPTGAPLEIAEALLYVFLVSPSFIQREELQDVSDGSGHTRLSSHEVAARLSFLLWGSLPDQTLQQAADEAKLETAAQVLQQAARMLKDPRAREMVSAFHRSYMLMGTNTRWDNTNKDTSLYPTFSRELAFVMQRETELFFDNIVFAKNGSFDDLIQSPVAFVNSATAPLYGLDPAKFSTSLTETTLDARRPGFLTRLGFLNAYSGYEGTSPILRGAFITKQVLGMKVAAPPPGAEQTPLPPASAELDTNRKRFDALTSAPQCAACHHDFINPPGFALEAFDTVGSFQTAERTSGTPIDTTADVQVDFFGPAIHVSGPAELMAAIAKSDSAKSRYASEWVSYSTGRRGDPGDSCTVDGIAAKMTTNGYTVLNLISDLTQTLSFRVRTAEQ